MNSRFDDFNEEEFQILASTESAFDDEPFEKVLIDDGYNEYIGYECNGCQRSGQRFASIAHKPWCKYSVINIRKIENQWSPGGNNLPRQIDNIFDKGRAQIGTPYVWGATNPGGGFDCSGFTEYVYRGAANLKGLTAGGQYIKVDKIGNMKNSLNDARPGDLIFYDYGSGRKPADHVGVYVGKKKGVPYTLESASGGVKLSPVYTPNIIGVGSPIKKDIYKEYVRNLREQKRKIKQRKIERRENRREDGTDDNTQPDKSTDNNPVGKVRKVLINYIKELKQQERQEDRGDRDRGDGRGRDRNDRGEDRGDGGRDRSNKDKGGNNKRHSSFVKEAINQIVYQSPYQRSGDWGVSPGTSNEEAYAARLLKKIKAPVTVNNMNLMKAWFAAEGTAARNNPLATTMPGGSSFNSVGVQDYSSVGQGLKATRDTLLNGLYDQIVSDLRNSSNPYETASSGQFNTWGTGQGTMNVLRYNDAPSNAVTVFKLKPEMKQNIRRNLGITPKEFARDVVRKGELHPAQYLHELARAKREKERERQENRDGSRPDAPPRDDSHREGPGRNRREDTNEALDKHIEDLRRSERERNDRDRGSGDKRGKKNR